jgi:hypothetical protein
LLRWPLDSPFDKGLNIKSIQHCSIPILWSKNETNGP